MVKKIKASRIGVEGCLRKATDVLFWPGMSAEIKDCVSKCDTCNTYQANQEKEPLIPHDPPKRPWSHVATDLFSFDNKDWFIVVDYWSDYFELKTPMQVQLSSHSRISLHAMAFRIHLVHENYKSTFFIVILLPLSLIIHSMYFMHFFCRLVR